MAKPINPYQGAAPAAMAQMGQGILEAGARIGQTIQSGYESMGKGLASGITAAADAYGDYKKMQSGIKASEKAYDTFKGFLDPEARKSIDEKIEGVNKDTSLSLQDKAAFWEQAKSFIGGSVNQNFAMQKQKAELDAAAARQAASIQEQAMAPYRQQAASLLANPMVGTDFGAGQRLSTPPQRQRTDFFGNLVN
jgi:hypothetical protein